MSVIVMLMLGAFAAYKFIVLVNKIEPDVSKKDNKRDLGGEPPYIPHKFGFDFAIGMRGGDLDYRMGYYRVRHVNFYYIDDPDEPGERKRIKANTDFAIDRCGTENLDYFD